MGKALYILLIPAAALILGVMFYLYIPLYKITGITKALDGILLMSSISLGFYGACLGILASIFNTKIMKEIIGDRDYRQEFISLACTSLITGFLTVIFTIIYQVLLENEVTNEVLFKIINSIWIVTTLSYFLYQILFIIVLFQIFFRNTDEEGGDRKERVFNPDLKNN